MFKNNNLYAVDYDLILFNLAKKWFLENAGKKAVQNYFF